MLKQQREFISQVLECPVYMDYSASECMRMGFECRYQNGYHMDIYNYYFEYLNGSRYANSNEIGDIVVTNLNNYVFPFIRYRIGDQAEPSRQLCQCGINLPMARISGRSTDIITTPAGKQLTGHFFTVLFEYMDNYVKQFRVIQIKKDELLIQVVPEEEINKDVIADIEKETLDYVDKSMAVRVVLVEEIEIDQTGKKRLMVPIK